MKIPDSNTIGVTCSNVPIDFEQIIHLDEPIVRGQLFEMMVERDRWKRIAMAGPLIECGWRTREGKPEGVMVTTLTFGFFAHPKDRLKEHWREFASLEEALLAWDEWQQGIKQGVGNVPQGS